MQTHHVSLRKPSVQEIRLVGTPDNSPADHLQISVRFTAPASEEWTRCFLTGFQPRVNKQFQLEGAGINLNHVEPGQKDSLLANLRQMVDEVNASLAEAQKPEGN
jgi:hypothetical protein